MPKRAKLDDSAQIYQQRVNQTEKEKLRDLSFKKKLQYLYDYYKLVALFIVIGIAILVFIIHSILTPNIESQLNITILNNPLEEQEIETYEQELAKRMQLDPKTQKIFVDSSIFFSSPDDANMIQVMLTRLAVGEIDVIIAPESLFSNYAYIGFFDKLSDDLPADLFDFFKDNHYFSELRDDPGNGGIFGIYLDKVFPNYRDESDRYLIGIVGSGKHKGNSEELFRFIQDLFHEQK